jgi:hypothetical protein
LEKLRPLQTPTMDRDRAVQAAAVYDSKVGRTRKMSTLLRQVGGAVTVLA